MDEKSIQTLQTSLQWHHYMQEKYEAFKEEIKTFRKDRTFSRDHPSVNEV